MSNDVAVFLDLDNLVIGAKQANLTFNVQLILDYLKEVTNGRIVLRRAYGDSSNRNLVKEMLAAGFTTQSAVPINSFSKNLADMQIVVDAMETLVDGHSYNTYVFITGDRDFTPLVQTLRKRGRQVIGIGVKNAASQSFMALCDRYTYYEDLIDTPTLSEERIEELFKQALEELLANEKQVRASIVKQHMLTLSDGAFGNSHHADHSFSKFLARFPQLVEMVKEDTTTYVRRPPTKGPPSRPLYKQYRTHLKKQKLRVVPSKERFRVLDDLIKTLKMEPEIQWRPLIDLLWEKYQAVEELEDGISKNKINAVLLLARRAEVIETRKGRSLSTAPVLLAINSGNHLRQATMLCDLTYLVEIEALSDTLDLEEASMALYENTKRVPYLQSLLNNRERLRRASSS